METLKEWLNRILDNLCNDILRLVDWFKEGLKHVGWWLIWNVRLGPFEPWVTGLAIWRWPRRQKTGLHPNPFVGDTEFVVVTGTERHNGLWVQCHHCKTGFPAFDNYAKYLLLIKDTLPKTSEKEEINRIEVVCPNCGKVNNYWMYDQSVKDMYERD